MSGSKKKSLRPTRNESRRFQSTDCGPGKYTGSENRWKWIKLRGWTTFVHFCSVEPSTHVSTNKQLRTQLSCLSPPKPEIQTNEASILWILDSAFRLTNYILVFSHWDFLILFTKVLKLRKLSKFRISSIPRIINLWFEIPTLDRTLVVTLWKRILEVPRLHSAENSRKLIFGFQLER